MSTVIDSRVVEMQFDNSNFEKNVASSINALDQMDQAINKASSNDGMTALENSVVYVGQKFSVLATIATGALLKIGNQAVSVAENMVKSLSTDQISAGWSKYAEKTSSVQTIVSATGLSIEEVNAQLEKLMWYSDETSYSFTDMADNIGKFTSNGVDLDTSVKAMEGISNWAAKSGQSSSAASRAMYNFSQALGAGAMKLQDWKSIENANMATKEFKETAIKTAVSLGKLKDMGDGTYEVIDDTGEALSKTAFTVEQFNTQLSQGWFDKDVILDTLSAYSEYSEAVYEYMQSEECEADTASDAMEEMARKGVGSYSELAKASFKAAQEAKTFSDAVESVKDAASSAWMSIFETLFGNYEEAKVLWTDLANWAYDVFVTPVNNFKENLEEALGFQGYDVSKWDEWSEQIEKAGISVDDLFEKVAEENGTTIDKVKEDYSSLQDYIMSGEVSASVINKALGDVISEKLKDSNEETKKNLIASEEELKKVANNVWRGDYGNGKARIEALTEAGYNYAQVQNKVNEMLNCSYRHDINDYMTYTKTKTALTEDQKKALEELGVDAALTDEELSEMIEQMTAMSGKELFKGALYNLMKFISYEDEATGIATGLVNVIGNALSASIGEPVYNIYSFIKAFYDVTDALILTEDQANALGNVLTLIFTSAVNVIAPVLKSIGRFASLINRIKTAVLAKGLGYIYEAFESISDITGWVGDSIYAIVNIIVTEIETFGNALGDCTVELSGIWSVVRIVVNVIKIFFDYIRIGTEALGFFLDCLSECVGFNDGKIAANFINMFRPLALFLNSVSHSLVKFEHSLANIDIQSKISEWFAPLLTFLAGGTVDANTKDGGWLVETFVNIYDYISRLSEACAALGDRLGGGFIDIKRQISDFFDGWQDTPEVIALVDALKDAWKSFVDGISNALGLENAESTITGFFEGLIDSINSIDGYIDIYPILEKIGTILTTIITNITEALNGNAGKVITSAVNAIYKTITSIYKSVKKTVTEFAKSEKTATTINKVLEAIKKTGSAIYKVISSIVGAIADGINDGLEKAGKDTDSTKSILDSMLDILSTIVSFIADIVVKFADWVSSSELIQSAFELLKTVISDIVTSLTSENGVLNNFFSNIASNAESAASVISSAFSNGGGIVDAFMSSIKDGFADPTTFAESFVSGISDALSTAGTNMFNISNLWTTLKKNGTKPLTSGITDSLSTGIENAGTKLSNYLNNLFSSASDAGKTATSTISTTGNSLLALAKDLFTSTESTELATSAVTEATESVSGYSSSLLKGKAYRRQYVTDTRLMAKESAVASKSLDQSESVNATTDAIESLDTAADNASSSVSTIGEYMSDQVTTSFNNVTSAMSGIVSTVNSFMNDNGGPLAVLAGAFLSTGFVKNMISVVGTLVDKINFARQPISTSLNIISAAFKTVGAAAKDTGTAIQNYFKAKTVRVYASVILMVAVAVLSLAASLTIVKDIPLEDLKKATISIGALIGMMSILALTLGVAAKKSKNVTSIGVMMLGLSAAILVMSAAMATIAKLDTSDILKGLLTIAAMCAMMAVISKSMAAVTAKKGNVKGFFLTAGAMLGAALGVVALVVALWALTKLNFNGIQNRLIALFAIFGIMSKAMSTASRAGGNAAKGAAGMMLMEAAMAIMIGVMYLYADVPSTLFTSAKYTIYQILILFAALAGINRLAGTGKAGSALLGLSVSLLAMYVVIKALNKIGAEELVKGCLVIGALIIFIGVFLLCVSKLAGFDAKKADVKGTLIALTVTIAAMLVLIAAVSWMAKGNKEALLISTGVILALMGFLSILIYSIAHLIPEKTAIIGTVATLVLVTAMMAVMVDLVAFLANNLNSTGKAILALGVIVVIILALSEFIKEVADLQKEVKVSSNFVKMMLSIVAIITVVGLLMMGLMAVTQATGGNIGTMLVAMTCMMAVLAGISAMISTLSEIKFDDSLQIIEIKSCIESVMKIIAEIAVLIAGLMFVNRLCGGKTSSMVAASASMISIMMALAGMILIFSKIKWVGNGTTQIAGIIKMMKASAQLIGIMGVIMAVLIGVAGWSHAGAGQIASIAAGFSAIILAIALMVKVVTSSNIKDAQINSAVKLVTKLGIIVLAIGAVFTVLIMATANMNADAGHIAMIVGSMVSILAMILFMITYMSKIKFEDSAAKNIRDVTLTVGTLITALAFIVGCMAIIMTYTNVDYTTVIGVAVAISIALIAVAVAVEKMSDVTIPKVDWTQFGMLVSIIIAAAFAIDMVLVAIAPYGTSGCVAAVAAASAIAIAMYGICTSLSKLNGVKIPKIDLKQFALIAVLVIAAGAMIPILINSVDGKYAAAITAAVSLGIVLVALGYSLKQLDKVKLPNFTVNRIVGIALIIVAIGGILAAMSNWIGPYWVSALAASVSLSVVLVALSYALKNLDKVKMVSISLDTVIMLAALMAAIGIVLSIMAQAINGYCAQALVAAVSMAIVMIAAAYAMNLLAKVGPLASTAENAILPMILFMLAIAALMFVIGGTTAYIPEAEVALEGFVTFASYLGKAVGAIIGGIIGGIGVGVMSAMPTIGTYLTNFMENMSGFVTAANNIPADLGTKISGLCKAINSFLGSGVKAWMASPFLGEANQDSMGLNTLSDIGSKLTEFSDNFTANPNEVLTKIDCLSKFFTAIQSMPKTGGRWQEWFGEKKLDSSFGETIGSLGEGLRTFSTTTAGVDPENVKTKAEALQIFVTMLDTMPKVGGIEQYLLGNSSFDGLADSIRALGGAMKAFSESTAEITDVKSFNQKSNALKSFVTMVNDMPACNGWAQTIFGQQDLGSLSVGITSLGQAMFNFNSAISIDSVEDIETKAGAASLFVTMINEMPTLGGAASWLLGDQSLVKLGNGIKKLGECMSLFVTSLEYTDLDRVSEGADAASGFVTLMNDMPAVGGVAQWFGGGQSLKKLGNGVKELGNAMALFEKSIGNGTDEGSADLSRIRDGASAASVFINAINGLPQTGGLSGLWDGSAGISDDLVSGIGNLGDALVAFGSSLGGEEVDITAIQNGADAVSTLSSAAASLDGAQSGTDALSNLAAAGTSLVADGDGFANLGKCLEDLQEAMSSVNTEEISADAQALGNVITALNGLAGNSTTSDTGSIVSGITNTASAVSGAIDTVDDALNNSSMGTLVSGATTFLDNSTDVSSLIGSGLTALLSSSSTNVSFSDLSSMFGEGFDVTNLATYISGMSNADELLSGLKEKLSESDYSALQSEIDELSEATETVSTVDGDETTTTLNNAVGDATLDPDFQTKIEGIAEAIKTFGSSLEGVKVEDVNTASEAFASIVTGLNEVPYLCNLNIETIADAMGYAGTGLNNFATNIGSTTYDNVADAATALTTVGQALADLSSFVITDPSIIINGINSLATAGVTTFCNTWANSGTEAATAMTTFITSMETSVNETAQSTICEQFKTVAENIVSVVAQTFTDKAKVLDGAGSDAVAQIKTGIDNAVKDADFPFEDYMTVVFNGLEDRIPDLQVTGSSAGLFFAKGISSKSVNAKAAATSLLAAAKNAVFSSGSTGYTYGNYFGTGYKNGIGSQNSPVYQAAYKLAQQAMQGVADGQKSSSPSKEAYKLGSYFDQGYSMAIAENASEAKTNAYNMASDSVNAISKAVSQVASTIPQLEDYTPTIRPIIDMSNIDAGVSTINSKFSKTHALAASASVKMAVTSKSDDLAEAVSIGRDILAAVRAGKVITIDGKTTIGYVNRGLGRA